MSKNRKWIYTKKEVERRVKKLSEKMKKELQDQGHVAKGGLLRSVTPKTKFTASRNITGVVKGFARGKKLDKYSSAEFVTLSDIIKWMNAKETHQGARFSYKRSDSKAKKRVAFAIRRSLERNGRRLTYKGKTRTGWITRPYNKFLRDIDQKLANPVAQDFSRFLDQVLEEMASKNENITYKK